jgi:hypothetical protein
VRRSCTSSLSNPLLWSQPISLPSQLTDVEVADIVVAKVSSPLVPSANVIILVGCAGLLSGLQAFDADDDFGGPQCDDLERTHPDGTDGQT